MSSPKSAPTNASMTPAIPPIPMRMENGRQVIDVEVPRILPGQPPLPYETIDIETEDGEVLRVPINLPYDDGETLESDWHRNAMNLLIYSMQWHCRDRSDIFVGGNMFLHYSPQRALARDFKGPDFFFRYIACME